MNKWISYISSLILDDDHRIYRHILVQVVILIITIGIFFDAPDRLHFSLNRFYGWITYHLLMNLLVYFNAFVLYPQFLAKGKIKLYITSAILFSIFSMILLVLLQEFFYDIAVIQEEESSLVAIVISIVSSLLSILLFIGGISALLVFKEWIKSNQKIAELKSTTTELELKFLKSQINPHFLFNMLNNAGILVEDDPEMASDILLKLDELLKYQLNDSQKNKIHINSDITFLTNYLELEKVRRDSFEYKITKTDNLSEVEVPPLLFIPFVENAVKHNLDNSKKQYVYISFELDEKNQLFFSCINSRSSTVINKDVGGLGLSNIKQRLDLLFENRYTLEQEKTETEYSVKLKLAL